VHSVNVTAADARGIEAAVHRDLADCRLEGEWFRVAADKAIAAIEAEVGQRAKVADRLERSRREYRDHPGTIGRFVYCRYCFHRGRIAIPLGQQPPPKLKCSKCGEGRPLVAGVDPMRKWLKANRARIEAASSEWSA
jgi:hypothetical protein